MPFSRRNYRLVRLFGFATFAVFALATSAFARDGGGDEAPAAWRFLGRLHPMAVHLPIGLIVAAALFEGLAFAKRQTASTAAVACVSLAAWATLVAAFFGWVNADNEPRAASLESTLSWHKWLGVALVGATFLTALVARRGKDVVAYRLLLLVCLVIVSIGGHFGGTLTHGEGYLTDLFESEEPNVDSDALAAARAEVVSSKGEVESGTQSGASSTSDRVAQTDVVPADQVHFGRDVWPILESRCIECHGPAKKKGNLRLDTEAHVFAGKREDWRIIPGDAEASPCYERVILPVDDDDRMPPKGDPLAAEQIDVLRRWIDQGARWGEADSSVTSVATSAAHDDATEAVTSALQADDTTLPPAIDVGEAVDVPTDVPTNERETGVDANPLADVTTGAEESSTSTGAETSSADADQPAETTPPTGETGVPTPSADTPSDAAVALAVAGDEVDYVKHIQPVFAARCFECHGPKKKKAGLRLDGKQHVFGGSKDEWTIVPGDATNSLVYERIILPDDDDDRMPPKGDTLSAEQIELVKKWIDQGAKYPDAATSEASKPATDPRAFPLPPLDDAAKQAEAVALSKLKKRGAFARRVAQDEDAVDVNLAVIGKGVKAGDLELLKGLEPTLVWLNVARSEIPSGSFGGLGGYVELRRLHLDHTAFADADAPLLEKFEHLEYLNLVGSAIGDAGLEVLRQLPALKRVYLWQSKATAEGVAALRRARPKLLVNFGD